MFVFRTLKIIAGIVTAIWIFFGEIASTFPSENAHELPVGNSKDIPFSHRLSNELSTLPSTASIDSIFSDFMRKRKIKGASVAVSRKGQLLYAKGFGYADEELGIRTEPWHLFRIASVSKLITSVAIMKMKENGHIDLQEKVFGTEGILNDSVFLDYRDSRVEQITVQQLLNHTAGWRHKGRDPVFRAIEIKRKSGIRDRNININDVIRFVLDQKLDYNPGAKYSYSNFGYALLGKVIEIKS